MIDSRFSMTGFFSDQIRQEVVKTIGCTLLTFVCGYGGTFFFTTLNPGQAALYIAKVSLVSQVSYHIFEKLKNNVQSPLLKNTITVIQLLQIPLFFYLLHGGAILTGVEKLEMVVATAYFTAIPVFFHLGIIAWNDPSVTNIAAAVGVMLPLANGLGNYARAFRV